MCLHCLLKFNYVLSNKVSHLNAVPGSVYTIGRLSCAVARDEHKKKSDGKVERTEKRSLLNVYMFMFKSATVYLYV